jgi:hypothetical protein
VPGMGERDEPPPRPRAEASFASWTLRVCGMLGAPPAADDLLRRCEKEETCDEDDVETGVEVARAKAERCTRGSGTVWWLMG